MQLVVQPDDLMSTAAAVRGAHASLTGDREDFAQVSSRLAAGLGASAQDSAGRTAAAMLTAIESVEDDLATLARGLTAIAVAYGQVDGSGR